MGDRDRLGVVFVHGFASGPKVWDRFLSLIEGDADLDFVDTRTLGYATGFGRLRPDRALPSLSTVADHLKTLLETEPAHRPLVLVGHSMGGLVIQRWLVRMLAEGRGRELARIRRIVLLACPNAAPISPAARRQLLGGNPQERQLRTLDEDVRDTHTAVLRDIVGADAVSERTCPIPFSVYAAESDAVVPRASAQGPFPAAVCCPGTTSASYSPAPATTPRTPRCGTCSARRPAAAIRPPYAPSRRSRPRPSKCTALPSPEAARKTRATGR